MRISDWSSDVCSSDLITLRALELGAVDFVFKPGTDLTGRFDAYSAEIIAKVKAAARSKPRIRTTVPTVTPRLSECAVCRSEEHTSELQSLMRISYAVFCLKKKQKHNYVVQHTEVSHTTASKSTNLNTINKNIQTL